MRVADAEGCRGFVQSCFGGNDFAKWAGIPRQTAHRIVAVLRDEHILKEVVKGKGRRAGVFMLSDLLNITEGHQIF